MEIVRTCGFCYRVVVCAGETRADSSVFSQAGWRAATLGPKAVLPALLQRFRPQWPLRLPCLPGQDRDTP